MYATVYETLRIECVGGCGLLEKKLWLILYDHCEFIRQYFSCDEILMYVTVDKAEAVLN